MIVRTYGRRNRCVGRSFSESSFGGAGVEDDDLFRDSISQGQDCSSSQDVFGDFVPPPFSSEDSSPWSLDPDLHASSSSQSYRDKFDSQPFPLLRKGNAPVPKPKRSSRNLGNSGDFRKRTPTTSTLMEAQEFGEMMEHVDEVNFALDGLRPGQPSRVRRSSLLSLLSICMTAQQRRLLRAQGMAKVVIDAVLDLSIDDSPSILAAATLFYVLASDAQDDHLLDSPPCIHFLLKLLNPSIPASTDERKPNAGVKLLSICRDPSLLRGASNKLDSISSSITSKVQEILLSCKEIKPWSGDTDGIMRPELDSKWIALLTIEKACLSTVSLEDRSATVRRMGGNFKDKFREHGGLGAVFDVAVNWYTVMEGLNQKLPSYQEFKKDLSAFKSTVLLFKCLKIMENATFLSKENQNHLLDMNVKLDTNGPLITFVGLVLSAIKILSGLSLLKCSTCITDEERPLNILHKQGPQACHDSEIRLKHAYRDDEDGIMSNVSIEKSCIQQLSSLGNCSKESRKRRKFFASQSEFSFSDYAATSTSASDVYPIDREARLSSLDGSVSAETNISKIDSPGLGGRGHEPDYTGHEIQEDSQDPFAFDEDDFKPSKWDLLSTKKVACKIQKRNRKRREMNSVLRNGCELQIITRKDESTVNEKLHPYVDSAPSSVDEEDSDLLGDCLLTAVKVLMNLTNDNPEGCQKIASCGGLEIMASLIIDHFPMFDSTELGHGRKHLHDQELDFLVAILGLLVNLVEKNDQNRSRLAAATVPLPFSGIVRCKENQRDVIPLLCSIFLANRGVSETDGEGKLLPWNDEDTLLQGQREAEKMIIEAYAALLLAFLSTESENVRETIACCLPDHSLEVLVPVLERFVAFHLTLNMISPETHATVTKVIESCKEP